MTRTGRLLAGLLAAAASLVLVAGCSSGGKPSSTGTTAASSSELNDHTNSTYQGLGLDPAQPRPQFTLTDTAGKQFKFGQQTSGKPTLLYFGYTHCPDICPTTMADIAIALTQVPAAIRNETQVVFVTTDVKNDTGPVIAKWLAHFDSDVPNKFIGLYGTQTQIDTAQVAAHVTLAEGDGKQHSAQVLLYGSDDYARVAFLQSNNQSGQIAHDLQVVAAQK